MPEQPAEFNNLESLEGKLEWGGEEFLVNDRSREVHHYFHKTEACKLAEIGIEHMRFVEFLTDARQGLGRGSRLLDGHHRKYDLCRHCFRARDY